MDNICRKCGKPLYPTTAMRLVGDGLMMIPAYECHNWSCGTIYDMEGNELPQADGGDEEEDAEDVEIPPDLYGGHVGFYADVDGEPMHVLGDPNMSDETLKALQAMARAARKAIEDGTLPREDDDATT